VTFATIVASVLLMSSQTGYELWWLLSNG